MQNEIDNIYLANYAEVIKVGDGIVRLSGLAEAMSGEIVAFENNILGMVLNLEKDQIAAVVFDNDWFIGEGDIAIGTGVLAEVDCGDQLIGRVINGIGMPIDGYPIWNRSEMVSSLVEKKAPGIIERQSVRESLLTGIKAIDSLFPIGRGQRELIIGDRQTGKTAVAIDAIINQSIIKSPFQLDTRLDSEKLFCIYVCVGQKRSTVAQLIKTLKKFYSLGHSIIVSATASDPAPLQFIAPFSGCTMGEYFRDN